MSDGFDRGAHQGAEETKFERHLEVTVTVTAPTQSYTQKKRNKNKILCAVNVSLNKHEVNKMKQGAKPATDSLTSATG
jgi:hypothetical protein